MRPWSGLSLVPPMSRPTSVGEAGAADLHQPLAQLAAGQLGDAEPLVRGEARLLQRVGERIVADVVEQGREPDREAVLRRCAGPSSPRSSSAASARRVRW